MINPQLVYLAQTDTTVGFLSQNSDRLADLKQRDKKQPFIICVDSLKTLQNFTRVPTKFKNQVRRAKKTTYIYSNNKALRVIKDEAHLKFLRKLKWAYSSSANLTGKTFEKNYATLKADIIIEDVRGFFESTPSGIIKINKNSQRRLR
jgi:tRNA A37 threonylcarbamoyladenosine synthetase subunit TsaC/SUA5/YrdC